jgi:hypothetical protein
VSLDQQQVDIDWLLSTQRRLISALREALPYVPSDIWVGRTVFLIKEIETDLETIHLTRQGQRISAHTLPESGETNNNES